MKKLKFWAEKELGLVKRKMDIRNSLLAAETAAGAALLEADDLGGGNVRQSLDALDRKHAEARALEAAIGACRLKRTEAIKSERAAKVEDLRTRATESASALRSIETKLSRLLSQITQIEECEFVPAAAPKSNRLREEIGRLQREAQDIEASDVPKSGTVDLHDATTTDEVLMAVATFPAIGPTITDVLEWLEGCEDSAMVAHHPVFGDNPRRVRIEWDESGIKPDSYVFVPAFATKMQSQLDASEYYDVASGTFRPGIETKRGAWPSGIQPAEPPSRGWYRA